ncbi:MAG: phasin family protein [Steroidobacteraceae bacterium]
MTTPFAVTDYVDFSKRMLTPAIKFNEMAVKTLEQMARYQYTLAGDYLNFGIEQLQSVSQTKDVGELVSKQSELASSLVEKLTKRSQDLSKIAADAQAGFTKWVDETAALKVA